MCMVSSSMTGCFDDRMPPLSLDYDVQGRCESISLLKRAIEMYETNKYSKDLCDELPRHSK